MLIEEAMTANPKMVTSTDRLDHVEETMRSGGFRRIPVVDDGVLIGIVSASDLGPHRGHLNQTLVDAAMTTDLTTVEPSESLEHAACLMIERKIGGLPVVRDGAVVGIVTTTDVIRVLTRALGAPIEGVSRVDLPLQPGDYDVGGIAAIVSKAGGQVLEIGTNPFSGDDRHMYFVRFQGDNPEAIAEALGEAGYQVARLHTPG